MVPVPATTTTMTATATSTFNYNNNNNQHNVGVSDSGRHDVERPRAVRVRLASQASVSGDKPPDIQDALRVRSHFVGLKNHLWM
jgi:hypothetical protein